MYNIKKLVDLKTLNKYGFKLGKEYPNYEKCICNDSECEDYWLIPFNSDEPNEIFYADDDFSQPIWSIHVQFNRRLWIECVPSCTYHISNADMEQMFYVLKQMIEDGIIYDDYKTESDI